MLLAVSRVNESVPLFLVEGMKRRLGNGLLGGRRSPSSGLAFKRDTDDERDSLSHKLVRLLERELADVAVHDPHVASPTQPLDEAVADADVVVVATNHSAFEAPGAREAILEGAGPDCARRRPVERAGRRAGLRLRQRGRRAGAGRRVRRVLVTGGAGTIGAAVVRRLLRDPDYEVRVSDQRPAPTWMREGCEVHTGDLRDLDEARAATEGCSHVDPPRGDRRRHRELPPAPAHAHRGQQRALQRDRPRGARPRGRAVRLRLLLDGVRARDRVPDDRGPPARLPGPAVSAYGFSKLTGEVYCRAAHDEHGLPYTICRPFNAYGPGEMPDDEPGIAHAVPDLIRKALSGQRPLEIFGSGEQTRTLTHVDDIADGIVTAMSSPAGLNEDFNVSAGEELTVAEIARIVWEACGRAPDDFALEHLPSFAVDVQRRWPSVAKARARLGWEARIGVAEGIAQTVEWLREQEALAS